MQDKRYIAFIGMMRRYNCSNQVAQVILLTVPFGPCLISLAINSQLLPIAYSAP